MLVTEDGEAAHNTHFMVVFCHLFWWRTITNSVTIISDLIWSVPKYVAKTKITHILHTSLLTLQKIFTYNSTMHLLA
jgi:hypothetical protein